MLRSLHLFPALAATALVCAQEYTATVKTTVTKQESADWQKWSDKECFLNYPATWTNEGALGGDALAIFFAPADAANGFRERMHLARIDATGKSVEQIRKGLESDDELGVAGMRDLASSNDDGKVTMEFSGTFDGRPVRVKRELIVRDGKAWVLSYIAAPERYQDGLYLADAMFLSFAVK